MPVFCEWGKLQRYRKIEAKGATWVGSRISIIFSSTNSWFESQECSRMPKALSCVVKLLLKYGIVIARNRISMDVGNSITQITYYL
jgi:hypothetical protein